MLSLEKLQNVAHNDRLRGYVRTIMFDTRAICGFQKGRWFRNWLKNDAGENLGLSIFKRHFLAGFSKAELGIYYAKYCSYLAGQEQFLEGQHWKREWAAVISRFPGLNKFEICHPHIEYREDFRRPIPSLSSRSKLAQEILTDVDFCELYYEN